MSSSTDLSCKLSDYSIYVSTLDYTLVFCSFNLHACGRMSMSHEAIKNHWSCVISCLRPLKVNFMFKATFKILSAKSKIKTESIKLKIGDCFLKWQIKPTMWAGDVKHRIKFGQPINHWSSVLSYIKPLNPCFKFYSLLH